MGFMSHRRPHVEVRPEQKWDYISLNDFKSTSCLTPFAYCYLWFSLFLSMAVYGVDTFTAVNLLLFDKWSSDIELTQMVPFDIAKWIFSVCIILSVINLLYEHIRANRVMRRGSVAECYLDSLAARLESIRFGKGQGYKRFLVFAELTKSKKGAEYVALFSYFSFQSTIRVILCSGPRQAINALTLYSVYTAKLVIEGQDFESSLMSFFAKIKALGVQQTLILSGMMFTLVIWVFSFLSLLAGALFFVFFLWSYIPREDGGLSGYCERKANKRLMTIVSIKINKAMAEEERKRRKAELKAAKKTGENRPMSLKATLPDVGDDKLPSMPMLNRNDTVDTLPLYTSRVGTPGDFELGALDQKRPLPSRTGTMSSANTGFTNYSSRQPLVGGAAEMGRSNSPTPTLPQIDLSNFPPTRTATSASNSSFGPAPPLNRAPTNGSGFGGGYTASPATFSTETFPSVPPPVRSPMSGPNNYRGPAPYPMDDRQAQYPGRPTYDDYSSGRASPAPSVNSYRGGPLSPQGMGPGGYPSRSATNPMAPRGPGPHNGSLQSVGSGMPSRPFHQPTYSNGSQRSVNAPRQPQQYQQNSDSGEYDYFNRPPTASSQRSGPRAPAYGNGWGQDVERQGPRY
ncbi:hypothetical protein CONLIGDRAFT_656907 [Coniochaeta ligniaria NRRL 30616]|uniref:Pheromone-regulated membrane protein n=1 Tax=Coniochaeta ligniaria NRRL 30616 TaxID=1408157 RepID=A0A1J7ICQ5_9PEZI|nr:hypothetical protein CONLIGDRAFT_656907 [Coniochaeta ligniaria NRRL 30616]